MKKSIFVFLLILIGTSAGYAQEKDTVKVGVFITSLYDMSLPDNSFKADFWLWFNYTNDRLDMLESVEIINAKEVDKQIPSTEKKNGINWSTQKYQVVLKKQWNIEHFPFDRQNLEIFFEEAVADTSAIYLIADKKNSRLAEQVRIQGWKITSFDIVNGVSLYHTTYGDPVLSGESAYGHIKVQIRMQRSGIGLFLKLFIGVYIAFAISLLVYFIEPIQIDSRVGLSVGSLFAAVGNKYIVDSILPETINFTLVDKVHLLTFFLIFIALTVSVVSFYLEKGEKLRLAKRWDFVAFSISLILYIIFNAWLLYQAYYSEAEAFMYGNKF
ncbi:MAG: hypothetical protein NW226_11600 [Microscillaceae bacterium]|nr:hypothetical protein [Microscillaceae bacterium]